MSDLPTSRSARCRFCDSADTERFVDLGMSPLCESFLAADELDGMEPFYPLDVFVCTECFLVQLREYVTPDEIFREYAYFSSYSESWLAHARRYAEEATERFGLGKHSFVVELASNDGYLLRNFVERGIPCVGVEPAANVAEAARDVGVPTRVEFFGRETARALRDESAPADLIAANNVLAQVPDLNDFVSGIATLLAPKGVVTLEFPHLLELIEQNQFDTIYHEHFSYFSLGSCERILAAHGLEVFDVETLASHGGSLRVFACHRGARGGEVGAGLEKLRKREQEAGLGELGGYRGYAERVAETKRNLLAFLIDAKRAGRRVAGYGAPGKGNTLLNYCGIRGDFLDFTVDRNPYKHGRFLPGTRIPVFPVEKLAAEKPDDILILPWNLRREIVEQLAYTREWGARLVVPIPRLEVC
jgi:SAM-dependent methyltransferase